MKKELIYFATALMFFTRIPIPFNLPYSSEIMNKAQKYYPIVGWVVGAVAALVFWLANLVFSPSISIILSMMSTVILTGAFHEDGFTDSCDAFGGGYGKEKIMTIMKDSRIGAYGVIGIALLFLLKYAALIDIDSVSSMSVVAALIVAHTASRFMSMTMIYTHEYVTDIDKSKVKPMANKPLLFYALFFSLVTTLVVFALFPSWIFLLALPVGYLTKMIVAWYFKKHIGGYTGDCLGAIQQITEVVFYLSFIVLWKYI